MCRALRSARYGAHSACGVRSYTECSIGGDRTTRHVLPEKRHASAAQPRNRASGMAWGQTLMVGPTTPQHEKVRCCGVVFLGARASPASPMRGQACPLEHLRASGPLRAGCPRSQEGDLKRTCTAKRHENDEYRSRGLSWLDWNDDGAPRVPGHPRSRPVDCRGDQWRLLPEAIQGQFATPVHAVPLAPLTHDPLVVAQSQPVQHVLGTLPVLAGHAVGDP